MKLFKQTSPINLEFITQKANWSIIFLISAYIFVEKWFYVYSFQLLWKGTIVNRMVLAQKISEKMSAFCLIISLGISRSWQASSFRVSFFDIFKTYIFKGKSRTRVQLFYLKNHRMFSKVLITFAINHFVLWKFHSVLC